jgi:hypothetical protein
MPVWVWVLIGLATALGIFLYRHLVWIPRHSPLNQLDELPHLREAVTRVSHSEYVSLVEEHWRFALNVTPLRRPPELLPSDLDPPFHSTPSYSGTGPGREGEVVRWEVTVNKKASEWIAEGFNREGSRVVEHRFNPGSHRGNYANHSLEEYGQIGGAVGRDITAWVEHIVAPERPAETPHPAR